MAEKIVSPGVFTRENDLSFLPQGISQIGAAVVGPTEKGPAFVPTLVTSQAEYEQIFGTPKDYYTGYTVQNYLRDAGSVTVVRVAGTDGHTTLAGGSDGTVAVVAQDGDGDNIIVAVLENTETATATVSTIDDTTVSAPIITLDGTNYTVSLTPSDKNSLDKVLGTTPASEKDMYANIFFDVSDATSNNFNPNNIAAVERLALDVQNFTDDSESAYKTAATPFVQSQIFNGTSRYNLFKVHTLSVGENENTRYKIQISNVKSSDGTNYGTFTLTIRDFNDTDKRKVILETYNNLNLDPTSPNFISRRIGDRYLTIDSVGKITENGDYSNKSKYIRIEVRPEGTYPITAIPFGFAAYTVPVAFTSATHANYFPVVKYTNASTNGTNSSGFEFGDTSAKSARNNKNYLKALPVNNDGVGLNVGFALDNALSANGVGLSANLTGDIIADENFVSGSSYVITTVGSTNWATVTGIAGYTAAVGNVITAVAAGAGSGAAREYIDTAKRNFCLAFQGGYAGVDPTVDILKGEQITATNTQGFNCSLSTTAGTKAYTKALNAVSNPDEFDINLLVTPGIVRSLHPFVTTKAIDLCEAREDVFYIADFVGADGSITDVVEQASLVDSNYTATYYPWVKTIDTITNKIVAVPPSTLLVGTYAQNDRLGAEWFAPAGLNRGGIQGAVQVMNRLTQSERDTLYEGKVNPIAAFPGQGISAFGQKTLQESSSALDRINVRRLLINLKKFVASTSRFLVFEQNTGQTRAKFLNTVNPYLESVQQRQGLYAFRVVMDETNNTPDVIDRNILQGSVFLQPAKTAEFIVIDFNILPTGATFSV